MNAFPHKLLPLLCLPLLAQAGPPDMTTVAAKNPKQPMEAAVLPAPRPEWTIGAGVQWRQIGEASFRGGSRARLHHLPAAPRSGGGISSGYSNGFVLPDSANNSQTWNWGYDSASQVSGGFLTLSSSSRQVFTETLASSYNTDWSDDLSGAGVYFLLESPDLVKWRNFSLSAALGYSFVQDDTSRESVAFRAERTTWVRTRNVADLYDVSAIAPLPAAPYSGSFNGPGPLISLAPARRSGGGVREQSSGTEIFTSELSQSLEVQLHTISLGPRFDVEFGSLRLLAGLGYALNIVPWDADSQETLRSNRRGPLRTWRDSASDTDLLSGLYAEISAEWRFARQWSLSAGARYDWSESLQGEVGAADFDVDLGGWTATLGLGFHF